MVFRRHERAKYLNKQTASVQVAALGGAQFVHAEVYAQNVPFAENILLTISIAARGTQDQRDLVEIKAATVLQRKYTSNQLHRVSLDLASKYKCIYTCTV